MENSKKLVVYYSYTGHTKVIAESIQKELGCDILEIKPFATNAGWLGQTFQEIKRLCPDSKVEKGMNIVFTEDYHENQLVTSPDEVDNWINNLKS